MVKSSAEQHEKHEKMVLKYAINGPIGRGAVHVESIISEKPTSFHSEYIYVAVDVFSDESIQRIWLIDNRCEYLKWLNRKSDQGGRKWLGWLSMRSFFGGKVN